MRVLGIKPRSSARATRAINALATSPSSQSNSFTQNLCKVFISTRKTNLLYFKSQEMLQKSKTQNMSQTSCLTQCNQSAFLYFSLCGLIFSQVFTESFGEWEQKYHNSVFLLSWLIEVCISLAMWKLSNPLWCPFYKLSQVELSAQGAFHVPWGALGR